MKNLFAIIVILVGCLLLAVAVNHENNKLTADLKYTIDQFNKMSIKAKCLQGRNEVLEHANLALIGVCKP